LAFLPLGAASFPWPKATLPVPARLLKLMLTFHPPDPDPGCGCGCGSKARPCPRPCPCLAPAGAALRSSVALAMLPSRSAPPSLSLPLSSPWPVLSPPSAAAAMVHTLPPFLVQLRIAWPPHHRRGRGRPTWTNLTLTTAHGCLSSSRS
jgi:hypothetical protein